MKPAAFDYHRAASLADALGALERHGEGALLIAGGQSLGPMLNMRLVQPEILVDLNSVGELAGIRQEGDTIVIGAMTRHHDVARDLILNRAAPLMARAAATVGHYAIRHRGTIGGSLAHADPAAQLPAAALALGAEMEITSRTGLRREPASAFFVSTFETSLDPGEILTAIRVPAARPGDGWGFHLFSRRPGDFAIALAAARMSSDGRVDLAFGGVSATPVGRRVQAEATPSWPIEAAATLSAGLDIDESPGVPVQFRREIAALMAERALDDARRRSAVLA